MSSTGASYDTATHGAQPDQSMWFNLTNATIQPRATSYQDASRQRYQLDQLDRGYHKREEKGVYQIDNDGRE